MNARTPALAPRRDAARERPTTYRYWVPALIALCLACWVMAVAAGRVIIDHI
jgi:hypothetical protein